MLVQAAGAVVCGALIGSCLYHLSWKFVSFPEEPIVNKTVLITGGNSGLGLETAKALGKRGARLILACKSGIPGEKSPEMAVERLRRLYPKLEVEAVELDLADLEQIDCAIGQLARRNIQVDRVVCNAGVCMASLQLSKQGFEMGFAVNYLGHFYLLTRMIRANLLKSASRIVIISSQAHQMAAPLSSVELGTPHAFGVASAMHEYAHNKLCLTTFACELARRHPATTVFSICPGAMATNIARHQPWYFRPFTAIFFNLFFKSPSSAALPVVRLLLDPSLSPSSSFSGAYFYMLTRTRPRDDACDPAVAERLWSDTERLIANCKL